VHSIDSMIPEAQVAASSNRKFDSTGQARGKGKGDRINRPAPRVPRPVRDREARRNVSIIPARHASGLWQYTPSF
jgi:hypothetical protein